MHVDGYVPDHDTLFAVPSGGVECAPAVLAAAIALWERARAREAVDTLVQFIVQLGGVEAAELAVGAALALYRRCLGVSWTERGNVLQGDVIFSVRRGDVSLWLFSCSLVRIPPPPFPPRIHSTMAWCFAHH